MKSSGDWSVDRTFEYAIIRFVPEAFRGEQINVGLIVFDGSKLDVRLYAQPSVFRVFGVEPATLEWMPAYLREHDDPELPVHSRWQRLAKLPGFALSELGWLIAETDEQYELRLERIRSDYIERRRLSEPRKRSTSLVRELRNVFSEYHVMGRAVSDVDRHKVVSNLPVGPAGKLSVDFVVKNGVYHATETADFRSTEEVGVAELKEAALASVTLQCAREQLGEGSKCYLVYSAPAVIEGALSPALQVAERGVDRMFNISSGDQRRDYFDLMLAAAGFSSFFGNRN